MRTALLALASALATAACAASPRTDREVVTPPGSASLAPYSPAIRVGGLVFLSGQVGLRPGTRELVSGGIEAETRQALENINTLLGTAGLTPADVAKCTVFLADMRDYAAMNRVYAEFFATEPPARSAVGVNGLPLNARVEIECTARAR